MLKCHLWSDTEKDLGMKTGPDVKKEEGEERGQKGQRAEENGHERMNEHPLIHFLKKDSAIHFFHFHHSQRTLQFNI